MRSVLITGGSGFFGRGLARRLLADGCERICIYSRDEHKQATMREQLDGGDRMRFFIGDVRDLARLRHAMDGVDVVIHAAALKRIEVGYYNPGEMIKTNIGGATNVVEAAAAAGVRKVVALSTDKAYQPVSCYGQSKALAESIFLNANHARGANGPIFSVTRYGNVAASAGSVIPRWREAAAMGKQLIVTDPDCTRFWMTLDEAIDLVLNAVRTMQGGELSIPDLPAYRLGDLVEIMQVGVGHKVVGLPLWEKLHESMDEKRSSDRARRMSQSELIVALADV